MTESIQKCCRICLDIDSEHLPIFEDHSTIQLYIKTCLSMNISPTDELPKTVCVNCASMLSEFYHMMLNARTSQDWLESCIQQSSKKINDTRHIVQPLPDSEYNSDSLLEFLNNTSNIEEYLNNIGKEGVPSIINMVDKNTENSLDIKSCGITPKSPSPKKKETVIKIAKNAMKVDVLDSDFDIVKEILMKETDKKPTTKHSCIGCKTKFDTIEQLSQHLIICDTAIRTCWKCSSTFDSRFKMLKHLVTHISSLPITCDCRIQLTSKEMAIKHYSTCYKNFGNITCTFKCKNCGKVFLDRVKLFRHIKVHLKEQAKRICDICGHHFLNDIELSVHRSKEHNINGDVMYRCKVCSFTAKSRPAVYMHVKDHVLSSDKSSHLCEACGRSFATRASLTRHIVSHKRDSNFDIQRAESTICEHCGLSLDSEQLREHTCVSSIVVS